MKATLLFAASAAATPISSTLLSQMTYSYIQRGAGPGYGYDEATFYTGLETALTQLKNSSLVDWYANQIATVVSSDGTLLDFNTTYYSLDHYRIGNNILWWYNHTKEEKYKSAADKIRDQLNRHTRNEAGGFWHRDPVYPNQMWLDGIYMADSFYGAWTRMFDNGNETAWDDIALQYDLIEEHCAYGDTGLLVHGYDESKVAVWADPVTGAAPLVWSRALGWYYMSLLESIGNFPAGHPARERLIGYFAKISGGLKGAQDESGLWWLIMGEDYVGKEGNYLESSASAMFTFGLLRGLRLGFISEREFGAVAKKAYQGFVRDFVTKNDDGSLNIIDTVEVGSLGSNGTYEYYISVATRSNDMRTGGAFLLASYEWQLRK